MSNPKYAMREIINIKRAFLFLLYLCLISVIVFSTSIQQSLNNNKESTKLPEKEKIEVAYSDLVTLEEALTLCHEETGWYVSLENLDDTLNPNAGFDFIGYGGGTSVIDDNTGMFYPELYDFTNPIHIWPGPYVIYQPGRIAGSDSDYDEGSPLDPWDKEYLFYSPLGLIEPKSRSISLRYGGNMFDRYAVLSRGPDMVISSDDIVVRFGIPPQSLVMSFLNPSSGYPGDEIEILGYNFGDEQSTSKVLFNGIDAGIANLWSNTKIKINVPIGATSGPVTVIVNSNPSNSLEFFLLTSVSPNIWSLYE